MVHMAIIAVGKINDAVSFSIIYVEAATGREVLENGYLVSQQQCLHRICSKTKSEVGGTVKTR